MNIAVTGATGFLGRYIVRHLTRQGHDCTAWHRPGSDRGGFEDLPRQPSWIVGELGLPEAAQRLVEGTEAVVHAALFRPGAGLRGAEGDLPTFIEKNVVGTIRLIEAARFAGGRRFIFISTCAVHEIILGDRKLDEAHPCWSTSHYGAHKAAIEAFISSYGRGQGFGICALRPAGIYGLARPKIRSKWHGLVQAVRRGEPIASTKGGKEVHAQDVARAVELLLKASDVAGEVYNCCDRYIADQDVALIARELTASDSRIERLNQGPKNRIDTSKIRALGMTFGGEDRLRQTVKELLEA